MDEKLRRRARTASWACSVIACTVCAVWSGIHKLARPSDVSVRLQLGDRVSQLLIDVTCAYVPTQSHLAQAGSKPGGATEAAEKEKFQQLPGELPSGSEFIPFAVDSFGFIGAKASELLSRLASQAVTHGRPPELGESPEAGVRKALMLKRWKQALSVAVWSAVAFKQCKVANS